MDDITNLRFSRSANDVANKFMITGKFENFLSVAKFAFAYAVRNFYTKFDPASYEIPDSDGNNYNVGSFNEIEPYIRVLYPDTNTPYIYIRALILYGLQKLGEKIEFEGMSKISIYCK